MPPSFFLNEDVVQVAHDLIGKHLFSSINGELVGGMIIETEAYRGPDDRACHAYGNRHTKRTEVMFHEGGIAYVYLCYGIHPLLNVVTGPENHPHAVLIRALQPTHGLEIMKNRRGGKDNLCSGPGVVTQALGITLQHNGLSLLAPPLWIEEREILKLNIMTSPRIGVEYAKEDALLPWRFFTC